MSKSKIRNDKTCLNCQYIVENKFFPNCCQEKSDIRKTFHHLLIHFFEDFKHFENAFWITNKKFSIQSSCFNQRITLRQNIFLSGSRSIVYFNPFYSLFTSCYFSKCRKPLETSADKETTVTAKNRYFESNTPKKGQAEKASKYHYEILNF